LGWKYSKDIRKENFENGFYMEVLEGEEYEVGKITGKQEEYEVGNDSAKMLNKKNCLVTAKHE
jgi:hypothetical protein